MAKTESQPITIWRPSNLESLYRSLPPDSPLCSGVPMLDRVLFAFSNSELKSALFFYGLDHTPVSVSDIEERMRTKAPNLWSDVPQPHKVLHFMRSFICTAGFAKEFESRYFLTTPDGENIAKNSAAFLLSKAVDLETPFGPILKERSDENIQGQTRAYILRLAILFALKEGRALSHRELNEKIGAGVYDQVLWNLRALAQRRLVLYETSEMKADQSLYERGDLSLVPENLPSGTQKLIEYFAANERGNPRTLAKVSERSIVQTKKKLYRLAQTGVIRAVNDAIITPLGAHFITMVIEPMLAAYSGDEQGLQRLKEAGMRLLQEPDLAVRAIDQYRSKRLIQESLQPPVSKAGKYSGMLNKATFWLKLTEDVKLVPSGIAIDSFLRRFDPVYEGNMGSGLHHGTYYNLRQAFTRFSKTEAGIFLLTYRPPVNSPVDVVLAVRTAQRTIREHLEVRGVRPDDFSDLPALLQKREEQVNRLAVLKRYFEQFGRFDNNESLILKNVTLDQVRQWTPGIKGNDVDAISFAAIGFNLTESQNRFTYRGFPAELRSAFLIYAFEQYRKGAEVPVLPKDHEGDYVFKNQEVKKFLQVLEFYLTHYQEEARKKNPNAVLSVFNLVTFFEKYVDSKAT